MRKRNRKLLLWALPLVFVIYICSPLILQIFKEWDYNSKDIENMKIIAHRGGASIGPENTIACYKKGIEAGADMIEIDIHLTKDKKIVVCHDQSIDRTTNGKGKIREMTLEEIRQCRITDRNGNITAERIPTLNEVFDLMTAVRASGNPCNLLVEIKRTRNIYQGIEEQLLQSIYKYNAKDWVTVQSFDDFSLEETHRLDPTVRLEKLFFLKLPCIPVTVGWFTLDYFSYEKYHYVKSFNMNYLWLTKSFLRDIHEHGKEVKIWTLEGTDAPVLDVDGIITNRPDLWTQKTNTEQSTLNNQH